MPFFNELQRLTPSSLSPATSVQVSLVIPARSATQTLQTTVAQAHAFLQTRFANDFEIILVPNPAPTSSRHATNPVTVTDRSIECANQLVAQYSHVRSVPHHLPPGKGAAIRTGILASQGKWIFLTDADLPYDLSFFDQAADPLKNGVDLISGNRRLPNSLFILPVVVLPLAYSRHRLGLAFNWLVRHLFPIQTTDTQAGIKVLSRRLAIAFCQRQACPGFLYDLEIFLTAQALNYRHVEFPVTLRLMNEKSTVRLFREFGLVGVWLTRLFFRMKKKAYGKSNLT